MTADRAKSRRKPGRTPAEDARRAFAAWAAGETLPPAGQTPAQNQAWREREWKRLSVLVAADPDAWLSAAVEAVRSATDEAILARRSWLPFEVVLVVGGEPIQRRAAEVARTDPRIAAVTFWALRFYKELPGQPWTQEAALVSLLGLDTAVAAAVRLLRGVHAAPGDMSSWDTMDFWVFNLGARLGTLAPELGWDYVRRLVAAVPDELLGLVGTGELQNFCWVAGTQYIDQIEAEASGNPRFRTALADIGPGGERIPPTTYSRIRSAAGFKD